MQKHHEESLQIMKEYFQGDKDVIALILGGSVAKGEERPDSDLDAMVIITDQAYEKRKSEGTLMECLNKCTYECGYFDIKYFNKAYLEAAADRGSDPTRNSFVKAKIIFSSDPSIEKIIERIPIYPQDKKLERIKLFNSILRFASGYFYNCATRNNDHYMLDKCRFEIVYAGLRMLYAYNEVFFPSHVRLLEYANRLPSKPDGVVELAKAVSEKKDAESKDAFVDSIINFVDWGIDSQFVGSVYVEKMEQTWQFSDDNVYEL
ncbi:MAG: nucleotidyltransferase domain-containing protein [Defluviitaleaceae bacterium]|nr:nucleotidyltransferase domain-containing protein [Defluviitaleaceae bacterium]